MSQIKHPFIILIALVLIVAAVIAIPNVTRPRMAACEVSAIADLKAYCTAQEIYHRKCHNDSGVVEYALLANGPSGLCAPEIDEMNSSFGNAMYGEGHEVVPKHGYIFKILTAQGPNAKGGSLSYLTYDASKRPHLTEGYALVAAPADYSERNGATYIVDHSGTIFEYDFGPDTPEVFKNMKEFDPDSRWVIAE